MNIKKLKNQQIGLKAHDAAKIELDILLTKFQNNEEDLYAKIKQEFAKIGLEAHVQNYGGITILISPSPRSIKIIPWTRFEFNADRIRSEFIRSMAKYGDLAVAPLSPMALPIEISAGDSRICSIWWREPDDNQRLANISVNLFQFKKGPEELGYIDGSRCFIATAIFGESAEELVMLKKWRDEFLNKSKVGQKLIKTYYRFGPSCAKVVQNNSSIRWFIRNILLLFCSILSRIQKRYNKHSKQTASSKRSIR